MHLLDLFGKEPNSSGPDEGRRAAAPGPRDGLPAFALTIGVIGHRPQGRRIDAGKVGAAIAHILAEVRRAATQVVAAGDALKAAPRPLVACITSLAEGADRIGARAAVDLGIAFDAVLPFSVADYETTFVADGNAEAQAQSRAEFRALLAKARATLVLPGVLSAAAGGAPYVQAANTLLAHSDMLIAVLEENAVRAPGGTAETVDAARRLGLPVVEIDPEGRIRLADDADKPAAEHCSTAALDEWLGVKVRALLTPPGRVGHGSGSQPRSPRGLGRGFGAMAARVPGDDSEYEGLRAYCATPVDRRFRHSGWKWFRRACALDRADADLVEVPGGPPGLQAKARSGLRVGWLPREGRATNAAVLRRLARAERRADSIAVHYGHAFRSAFLLNFVLGVLAVACVAISLVVDEHLRPRIALLEMAIVALIVFNVAVANQRQWKRRWSEARELAERLRLMPVFWSLGVWPNMVATPQPAWTGWYARTLMRELPILSGDLATCGEQSRACLRRLIEDQIEYNRRAARDAHHIDRILEALGAGFVILSMLVAGAHVVDLFVAFHAPAWLDGILIAGAVLLPALATACYGIRLLGDFEDTSRRSHRLIEELEALSKRLESGRNLSLGELRQCAHLTSDALLANVARWRVAVDSRHISV